MATDTAPAPGPDARPARRHYWQLPVFALGAAAAVAAYIQFPLPPVSPADRFARDLSALRQALDHRSPDLETLTARVAASADQFADSAPTAHYLAGSGYVALAEFAPADAELWTAAAAHLTRVDANALPDPADQKRLVFRRAKAQAALGAGDPAALIAALDAPPPGEELGGERRRLLADAFLRASPPDLKRARDELKAYLTGPTVLPVAAQAAYRLKLGEIYLNLTDAGEARTWLKEVGPAAPAEVQARAKVLLAKLNAAENNWPEAAKLYEAAQAAPGLPEDQRAAVRYQAGVAYVRLRNPASAAPFFEQAARGAGPVATAAAVKLAELTLRDPARRGTRAKAVELLEAAVRDAKPGTEFRNPYLSAAEVQAAFEEAVQTCVNEADFASAVRAATAYAAVSAGGRDKERRAEANAAWAAALQQSAATAAQAPARFKEAAGDYLSLAAAYPTPAGKADLLRRAATCFRQAGDAPSAAAVLDQLTRTPGLPDDAAAAAWQERGELLLAENHFPEAVQALQKAMAGPGPTAARARVMLAVAHLDQARAKAAQTRNPLARTEAQALLTFAQDLLTQAANAAATAPAEQEAQQRALFELGKLLLNQQNFPDAEARLRQLLQTYPTSPSAGQAKLYLGSCLLLLARGDHQSGRPPADADRKLAEAAKLFEELSASADPFLRTQADIRLANATLLLKKYDDMPALCEKLADRYKGKVEELIVLSMLYSAYRASDRPEPAARTLSRMEEVFGKLKPEDFPGGPEEYTREYWVKQWFEPLKAKPAAGVPHTS